MKPDNELQTSGLNMDYLTKAEVAKVKRKVLGYGNFKRFSDAIGVSRATLRDILNKGYGSQDIVSKIRTGL